MKLNLKPRLLLPVIAAPFFALLFSFSTSDTENKKLNKNDFNGRQLFSALYLHDEVLTKELATYAKVRNVTQASDRQSDGYRHIITEIEKQDPAFFDNFKTAIVSGNHLAVRKGVETGQQMLVKTVKELHGSTLPEKDEELMPFPNVIPIIYVILYLPPVVEYVNLISQPVLPVAITLPLGPPTLPLSNGEAATLSKLKNDNLFCETLVNELVQKFN